MKNEHAARTIIDALGLEVDVAHLALLLTRATRAYSIGNMDDYRNQCDFIKLLVGKEGQ